MGLYLFTKEIINLEDKYLENLTKSKSHDMRFRLVEQIVKESDSMDEVALRLRDQRIKFDEYNIASGRNFIILTGHGDYDIIGINISNRTGEIKVSEIVRSH